jgi:flagellar motility protein MotE (MotC chaperone)
MPAKKQRWIPFNIFSLLAIIAVVALVFRLANIGKTDGNDSSSPVIASASAVEDPKKEPAEAVPEENLKDPEKAKPEPEEKPAGEKAADAEPATPAPMLDEPRAFSTAEIEVLQSLSKRRDALDQREKQMAEREALLTAAEQEVDKKISELKNMRDELKSLLGQQEKMEEERIVSLVRIYEGMKPKEAATIFNTLDMDILLAVIGRMSERKSGPILASMDPEKARTVTTRLAMQRRLPELNAPDKATPKP